MTRSVRDSAAILDATAGPDPGAPYVAPPAERPYLEEVRREPGRLRDQHSRAEPWLGRTVHPDCVARWTHRAAAAGGSATTVEEAAPGLRRAGFARAFLAMVCAELRGDHRRGGAPARAETATPRDLEPATWALGLLGRASARRSFPGDSPRCSGPRGEIAPLLRALRRAAHAHGGAPPVVTGALQPTPKRARSARAAGRLRAGRLFRGLRHPGAAPPTRCSSSSRGPR